MKNIYLVLIATLSFSLVADEGRLGRDSNEYQYTSFGFSFISAEDDGLALNASLALPGPLYAVFERRADGVDLDTESYDKVVNSFRVGAHSGIGDILNSISAKGISFSVENFLDIYAELGIKTSSLEGKINDFSDDDLQANAIAGIRFGDSNDWEGKLFVDFSKESDITILECQEEICTQEISYVLANETDRKFGAEAVFNISKHTAINFKAISSDVLDSSFEIGFRLTF
ncbi:hypothetical protein N8149_01265 [Gammaproteobacteria bacterium]|nr:hypothetical protein [Gammaproteobacteria bacterium]|tara:strand:- start:815 stop:1504 length:690 start_codon:yes stop_codon:yes gene_type:complete